jgi:hypothetical protein
MPNPSTAARLPRELTLEELLASNIVCRLMERDGVEPHFVEALRASIARASANASNRHFSIL